MSEASREFFNGTANSGPEITVVEAALEGVKEGVSSFTEGAGKVWDALATNLTPAFELGAEELTRAMFTGNAYVFHGDTIPHEYSQHATPVEPIPVQAMQKEAEVEREM